MNATRWRSDVLGVQRIDALERDLGSSRPVHRETIGLQTHKTRGQILLSDPECDSLLLRFAVASRQFDDDVLNLLVEIEPDASRKQLNV